MSSRDHPRALLAAFGYKPKKRLGQTFLMDAGAAARIARLATRGEPSTRILEIGAGTGELTAALVRESSDVTALEIDIRLVAILRSRDDVRPAAILCADAMEFDYDGFARSARWHVAGNLPYNIATPLVTRLIAMNDGPSTVTVMVQKDVADRFAARAGSRAYGSLSIAVQYAMRVDRAFTLGPSAFYPRPNVDSTVVQLTRLARPAITVANEARFMQVARAGFAYRRKTFANAIALALGVERAHTTAVLRRLKLDTEIRAEQLDLADFGRIADAL